MHAPAALLHTQHATEVPRGHRRQLPGGRYVAPGAPKRAAAEPAAVRAIWQLAAVGQACLGLVSGIKVVGGASGTSRLGLSAIEGARGPIAAAVIGISIAVLVLGLGLARVTVARGLLATWEAIAVVITAVTALQILPPGAIPDVIAVTLGASGAGLVDPAVTLAIDLVILCGLALPAVVQIAIRTRQQS